MTLPIDAHRGAFRSALREHRRVIVTAETGAGKSTRLPVWVAEDHGRVLVVEPRRVACRALATYLASETQTRLGERFGYVVRFAEHAGPHTSVVFVTPGVALRMLAESAEDVGAVVIDEYHERSWQTDLVVTLLVANHPQLPLVITSATIDAEELSRRYAAPTLHAAGRTYPVEVVHQQTPARPTLTDLQARAAAAVRQALAEHTGDILVFLPGMGEIRATEAALGRVDADVVVVHGSVTPEKLVRAFAPSAERRVFLSTNIAETSVTLPGVRVVIDSGLARMRIHRGGRAALATVPITEDALTQRCGRAGRVGPGTCVRLFSARYRPAATRPPEIERTELDDLVLQAAVHGLTGPRLGDAPWPSAPPEFAVARAQAHLRALGALDDRGLTPLGERLARLPVAASEAAVLADAPAELRGDLADVVALVQGRPLRLQPLETVPSHRREDVIDAREALLRGATSEVEEAVRLLRRGDARRHAISPRRLKEARSVATQLRRLAGADNRDSFDGLAVARHFVARLPESVFVLRQRAQRPSKRRAPSRLPWGNGHVEVEIEPYRPYVRDDDPPKPKAGVVLETEWLGLGGTRVTGRGRMLLPCPLRVLDDAKLGEIELAEPRVVRKARRVEAEVVRRYAGVVLSRRTEVLQGPPLCGALATFILDGRLIADGAAHVQDAVHLWRLIHAWPSPEKLGITRAVPEPIDDVEAWLSRRLSELGVAALGDLELVEPEDITPDLEALTGMPPWSLERLAEDFPRTWTDHGARYAIEIDPVRQRVVLTPVNKAAKKAKDPTPARLPRFRGFSVVLHHASRQQRLR